MKLTTVCLCMMCVSVFGQNGTDEQRLARQLAQEDIVASTIIQHKPVALPGAPLGSTARITALGIKQDKGANFLRLVGVEIRDDNLIIQADELSYSWATGVVEIIGKVRVKAIPR